MGTPREHRTNPSDITDISSNHAALQYMYELESIQWRGGDLYWDGPHDNFCFSCGGTIELFGCQTCEISFHAQCMSPTIDPAEVPKFWFCPHCVDREFHIPPGSPTTYFTPVSVPGHVKTQTSYFTPVSLTTDLNSQVESVSATKKADIAPQTPLMHPSERASSTPQRINSQHQDCHRKPDYNVLRNPAYTHIEELSSKQHTEGVTPADAYQKHVKRGRPKRSQTPPRKKSKYSAFSAQVDKALAVIYGELESAAENGKSEGHLQNKIQSLEQQLKLQDGQLMLTKRELELARKDLDIERFRNSRFANGRFEDEMRASNEEVARLKELVEEKNAELNDWRVKLKSMIG